MSHSSPTPLPIPLPIPLAIILSPNAHDNYLEWRSHVHLLLSNAHLSSISVNPHAVDTDTTTNRHVPEPRPLLPGVDRDNWDDRAKAALKIIHSTLSVPHRLDIAEETEPAEALTLMADLHEQYNVRGTFRLLVLPLKGNESGSGERKRDNQVTFIGALGIRAEESVRKIMERASAETFGVVSCGFDQSHVSLVVQAYGEGWDWREMMSFR